MHDDSTMYNDTRTNERIKCDQVRLDVQLNVISTTGRSPARTGAQAWNTTYGEGRERRSAETLSFFHPARPFFSKSPKPLNCTLLHFRYLKWNTGERNIDEEDIRVFRIFILK
ncbi:PREDICTED: uncharacterized protein LOC105150560 [Acromyrmex echinatior]|uniref:uncharacterized protein LOC105150560 n=1 Tax=Acromyrmex echinatior TaxID=103372 RepID=UPI000580F8A3|nr:PREDICTED: uncharacterized protein LOC105150560 [Acromyrmex echinatior]